MYDLSIVLHRKCNPSSFAEVKKIINILHSAGRIPIDSEVKCFNQC